MQKLKDTNSQILKIVFFSLIRIQKTKKFKFMSFNHCTQIRLFSLLFLITFSATLLAQITFEQTQSISSNTYSGPLLTMRHNDSDAFSEMSISNNLGRKFSLGITGSTNTFFGSNFTSAPYLYNGSGQAFQFVSGNDESFRFFVDSANRVKIENLD